MLEIPEVNHLDLAFGSILHMPAYETVPDQFKDRGNPYVRAISSWFFNGAKGNAEGIVIDGNNFTVKAGVDRSKAIAAIRAVLASFEPKHEHKQAACAYMLSEWFDLNKDAKL